MPTLRDGVLIVLVVSSLARADSVVDDTHCPAGSKAELDHAGSWCVPEACTTDADCSTGHCLDWSICTQSVTHSMGGLGNVTRTEEERRRVLSVVVSTCAAGYRCPEPSDEVDTFYDEHERGPARCEIQTVCLEYDELPRAMRATRREPDESEMRPETMTETMSEERVATSEMGAPTQTPSATGCGGCSTGGSGPWAALLMWLLVRRRPRSAPFPSSSFQSSKQGGGAR